MLRLINAAMNDELFFSIANHTVTIVEADATYIKPFETDVVFITPGQTTNVLLKTKPFHPNATFFMAASPYFTGQGTFDNSTVAGILEYSTNKSQTVFKPSLPPINATAVVANFTKRFRSLANAKFPANVPQTVQERFFLTVGLGSAPCPANMTCQGPNGTKFAASVNNVSFALPSSSALLQSYFLKKSNSIYTTDFPIKPINPFNYTGTPPNNTLVTNSTKVVVLPFNTSVELVLQGTSILGAENHPLHLHGFNFFVVGEGFSNFDPNNDPPKFNLVDPVERNTVGVPSAGWVAIRFLADNPGTLPSLPMNLILFKKLNIVALLLITVYTTNRSLVYALSFRFAYELGFKDGMDRVGWTFAKPKIASTTFRSSQVLIPFLESSCFVLRLFLCNFFMSFFLKFLI